MQNSEDLGASESRVLTRERDFLVAHNGAPVRLPDVVALAMPWLSSKADEAESTGRFGIGLMTLQSLSPHLEVHSGHYQVRIGDPYAFVAESLVVPDWFADDAWTVLRVPSAPGGGDPPRPCGHWDPMAGVPHYCAQSLGHRQGAQARRTHHDYRRRPPARTRRSRTGPRRSAGSGDRAGPLDECAVRPARQLAGARRNPVEPVEPCARSIGGRSVDGSRSAGVPAGSGERLECCALAA
ncbi:sacsin N-terminal ATP-binding-like domain-containing protein [Streptomyces bacillaris]|uniref:sacsin N-terminal ATP-binding-like domain-containing protein n=1 Tax=Streptomyces bacillaris TaxID=68179 RepID=UPI003D9F945A